jgi:hypothetical protein
MTAFFDAIYCKYTPVSKYKHLYLCVYLLLQDANKKEKSGDHKSGDETQYLFYWVYDGQQEFFFWPSLIHWGTDFPSALNFFSIFARTSGGNLVPQRFRL